VDAVEEIQRLILEHQTIRNKTGEERNQ